MFTKHRRPEPQPLIEEMPLTPDQYRFILLRLTAEMEKLSSPAPQAQKA